MKSRNFIFIIFLAPMLIHASEWFDGENLLLDPPDNSLFETYTKNEQGRKSTMWVSKTHKGGSTYVVNVVHSVPWNLGEFKSSQDKPGKESCNSFTTTPISNSNRNGYKSIFWETSCEVRGKNIRSIQLAIAGRDSFYHIRKLWKVPVTEKEYDAWKETIRNIFVCDTRRESNPCPAGYRKVR